MAITDRITVTHFTEDPNNGAIEIEFNWNGSIFPRVFESKAHMLTEMTPQLTTQDDAVKAIFNWWLSRDPNASNLTLIIGKEFKIDFSDPNPIKVN